MVEKKRPRSMWSRLTHFFGKRHTVKEKLSDLEKQVQELKEQCASDPPIVVEQLYVEKIVVDRVELNNNIGTMGIKELSGKLNIGANYGGGPPPEQKGPCTPFSNEPKNKKADGKRPTHGPKYNIRPKRE